MAATTIKEFEQIKLEKEDGIAVLTLHRPDKMNAFTGKMMQEMIAAFDETDKDDDIKVVIVTGSGERAFCAGADLSEGAKTFDYDARASSGEAGRTDKTDIQRDGGGRVTLRIFESLKPVIGAINGAAVGIGVTMQLPMDIRIASDNARFGFVFNKRGINPEAASSWFLPRLVGISKALEWCYTGRVFPAAEALSGGLVSEVVPQADLMSRARELAREIADNTAPVSNAVTRHMMWRMLGAEHPMEAHIVDSASIYERGQSADAKEGVMSFLEKRPAKYEGSVSKDMPTFFPWWSDPSFKWISKKGG
ncbi:MAG: enoyl-CoA hydratase [Henriciella sp.]|jgi:enoyl-CoA hydratase/carnithine racemase|uniref:crotonase/enoyl-CoA hydratase family protein n=1 Tax=Henriciella sp. TaxID=1968823 RepID=UPI000C0F9E29|nr:crotonase/enoyl-CoA hydratase family protein [Henriciella sp.]MAN74082.1 enoyl-CoA hydratase [Henriciella sp.]MBF34208.1 enoyl-CoA hydratase [Hyphomonadaceae bacterium]PHR74807.1 MAG: enoyl-CoA hydratase [Henriciella sp.]|tara:strand:+ start:1935 stop:2855 length:921 start_codon:yes stop_codon:yes gene_type:complete